MNVLPVSIEAYLADAGFSTTELLILRRLLDGEAVTLRELGVKTGKSAGVLDQAVRKLLSRHILTKENVNGTPKILLQSPDTIGAWVAHDMEAKMIAMKNRVQDFTAFIASLKRENARPGMEYFEGEEGLIKAYRKLLDLPTEKEMLCYEPATVKEEEDPLCAFKVQYFRERRRRGIVSRVLAPDTPLGRRYRSRDSFEYRRTVLLAPDVLPLPFEKIIVGKTVAYFMPQEHRACFLHFPEVAETERKVFSMLWDNALHSSPGADTTASAPTVALQTRILSSLREFFLSRKSIAFFIACTVAAAGITYGLWWQTYRLNLERERDRATSIVSMGATQFDARDLEQLRTIDDIHKPEYAKVIKKLNEIRSANEGVAYAWIMRPSEKREGYWEYVADADSIDPFAKIDSNYDGVIDEKDALQYPGYLYDEYNQYTEIEKRMPFSTPAFHNDQFGTYFTTTAPIRDSSGNFVAELGVDILIKQISLLTWNSLNFTMYFLGFFILFVITRYISFNKSLFLQAFRSIRHKSDNWMPNSRPPHY